MTVQTTSAATEGSHVGAYVSTGSSQGRAGRTRLNITSDTGHPIDAEVGWEAHGPAHAPAFVVLGGISASRHILPTAVDPTPGWWPTLVGPGRFLDPARTRLISIDYIGGTGDCDVPVTTRDQARAVHAVLEEVGVTDVTLVGASYGGMVALSFSALFPRRTRRVVAICAAHRSHPMATAVRWVQREVVRLGQRSRRDTESLALARGLAMTTYRSADEFEERFDASPVSDGGRASFPVQRYLEARGADFATRTDPRRFVRLSESIDLHHLDPACVTRPLTAVSFDTDTLVPPWLVDELVTGAGGPARHIRLASRYGHDAFLKEGAAVEAALAEESRRPEAGR